MMRQLVDTHVFIWFVRGDERLSPMANPDAPPTSNREHDRHLYGHG